MADGYVPANEAVTPQDDQDDESHGERAELQAMVLLYVRRPDGAYTLDRVLNTLHQFRCSGGNGASHAEPQGRCTPPSDGQGGPHDDDAPLSMAPTAVIETQAIAPQLSEPVLPS